MPNTTDYYGQCEDALTNRLRTLTTYFPQEWQVSNDDSNIARGANTFVILRPGRFPFDSKTMQEKDFTWYVMGRLYVKYTEYKEAWTRFKAIRAALINLIFPDYSLTVGGVGTPGVWRTSLSSEADALYFYFDEPKPGVRPNFIIQDLTFTIVQRVKFDI